MKGRVVRRTPSWKEVVKAAENWGWFSESLKPGQIILERGRQKIIAKKVSSKNKWVAEYFSGIVMDDVTGIENEIAAKKLVSEMAMFK